MAIGRFTDSGTPHVTETEDIDDSLDNVTRKDSSLSSPRAGDNPVQWVQFLKTFDEPEPSGRPFLYPGKIQMQKCDKCSLEFCSPINYRRHNRAYHRSKKHDKESKINRDLLGEYWDKLSVEEASEVVSFRNVELEEVPGSLILNALSTLIKNQTFSPLPQYYYYLRAGSAFLDIIDSRSSNFPISSQVLFHILDDSSEKTFLCGSAMSMQRYVFDGDARRICLEPKNIVACTSFLLEQKLAKAWLADKDAEALRCQNLLMEEEDAAQRRQTRILEKKHKKKLKKLKQKEQKATEQLEADTEIKENNRSTVEALSPAEVSLDTHDFEVHDPDTVVSHAPSPHVTFHCPETTEVVDRDPQSNNDCETHQNIEQQRSQGHNRQCLTVARRHGLQKSQRAVANGSGVSQNSQTSKLEVIQKCGTLHEQKADPIVEVSKVWTQKPKPEIGRVMSEARLQKEPEQGKKHEILIGSISIPLGNCSQSEGNLVASHADCMGVNLSEHNSAQEKPMKTDSSQSGNPVKLWRPVSQHGTKDQLPLQSGGTEADAVNRKNYQTLSGQSSLRLSDIDGNDIGSRNNISNPWAEVDPTNFRLSTHAAKAFLAQRWKEAISSDHVDLVVSLDSEPPGCQEVQDYELETGRSSDADKCSSLARAENPLPATAGVTKSIPRMNPGKGSKMKYIPKQKPAT
ncbi:hypothetical protein TanjilG_04685 [Lupinus angustifolius]|uniref:C2H2-type domain-containing protein n=1 Tax=Lupinus angustifolius TaxID=3871 RepID=A0A4P1RK78_LUPAN|nr:PREDICTED: uncharacterized protein LOC109346792 [Lupinus angustifolius]OIW12521.1 hypothetical protein TanjilG_04685 [Lupinus angustifolius]